MPPPPPPTPELEAITEYLTQRPHPAKLTREAHRYIERHPTTRGGEEPFVKEAAREVLKQKQKRENMPVLPKEGEKEDQVGKGLKEASEEGGGGKKTASVEQHQANPGPVMVEDLGEPVSKEELRKRTEELNKKKED